MSNLPSQIPSPGDVIRTSHTSRLDGSATFQFDMTLPESADPLKVTAKSTFSLEAKVEGSTGQMTIPLTFDDAIALLNWLDRHGIKK